MLLSSVLLRLVKTLKTWWRRLTLSDRRRMRSATTDVAVWSIAKKLSRRTTAYNIDWKGRSASRDQWCEDTSYKREGCFCEDVNSNQSDSKLIVLQVLAFTAQRNCLALCSQTLVMWNGTKVKPVALVAQCTLQVVNPRKTQEQRKV